MEIRFNNINEMDAFLEYFKDEVTEYDKVSLRAHADIFEWDYEDWCNEMNIDEETKDV